MQINPGGLLDIRDVVGRDNEIARYWDILARQGLVLSAERRIGKTHIALKMRDECREGYLPFYQDLESVHSLGELIRSVYDTINQSRSRPTGLKSLLAKWSTWFPDRVGPVDLPTGEKNWQAFLTTMFDDLMEISDGNVILLLWDEFPLMLHNLQRRHGPQLTIELLNHLRALRLAYADKLRFLLTGSIGLHLVLRNLQKEGNTNDPVNDMMSLTVPPMAHQHTCDLATALLKSTLAPPEHIPELASQIAAEVGGFPYYVHHVVDQLHQLHRPVNLEDVTAALNTLIYDPHDPANLNNYLSRLSSYYDDAERALALILLDTMAALSSPTHVSELANLSRYQEPSLSDDQVRDTLKLLAEDHYVTPHQTADGMAYDFRWQLVKLWWKETRL